MSEQQELVQLFADVFSGRFDCYAEAYPDPNKPNKVRYVLKKEPLTQDVLLDHLEGRRRIGIYPLVDGYVRWFAVDFDAPKDEDGRPVPDPFPLAWQEAEAQATSFETAGLFVYLERSRSGDGVHLWGFFDEPVEASLVLKALKPLLVNADSFDRMYPVQKAVKEGGYGNLIALPFHGESLESEKTAFLNRETLEPIEPIEFLRSVAFNNRYVIEELAENAPRELYELVTSSERVEHGEIDPSFTGRPERPLSGFLKLISPFGCKFMHHCTKDAKKISQEEWWVAIGQTTCFEHGRDAAHLISMLDPERYDPKTVDETYDRISQHPPHGCAYIRAKFEEHACAACPMKAPYHQATKPILSLVGSTTNPLAKPNWKAALKRIVGRNAGEVQNGIQWRTAGLDRYTRIRRGEFIVVGARPSVGKTAFMVDAIINLALEKVPVLVFSAETGEIPLTDRIIARLTQIDSKILRGEGLRPIIAEEIERVEDAVKLLELMPIYINFGATRADQILALVEETVLVNRIPLDQEFVVFMDYLQFGNATDTGKGDTEYTRISKVSSEFKGIGMILNQAFIALAQLNRGAEGEDDPKMSDAKSSGQIEQDANVFLALTGERMPGPVAKRSLHLLKDKEAEAGHRIDLLLHQSYCHFEPLFPKEADTEKKDLFATKVDAGDLI